MINLGPRPTPIEEYQRKRGKEPRFQLTDTNTLMAIEFPPIRWIVPGYIPEGFSVLAGRQKLGKTWLALDFALAVAVGGCALGSIEVEQGDVLYIDMENGERRIQGRIKVLYQHDCPDLSRLVWATEAPLLGKGFIDACEEWRLLAKNPKLIIIDVLQRIKPAGSKTRNAYENDYMIFAELQKWAIKHGIAVVGLHHTRKGGADDPLEALSGSNGLSAVADTTLVLNKDGNGTTLYVRGRDVEEKETALNFNGGIWSILGEAKDVRRSSERKEILSVLLTADAPMSPKDIAIATSMARNNVDQLLYKLGKAGEARKVVRGLWVHSDRIGDFGST